MMLPQPFLTAITDLGDSALLSAMVISSAFYLWMMQCRAGAKLLILPLIAASAEIGLLKMLFLSCSPVLRINMHSPSGHCALSVTVFGSYILLFKNRMKKLQFLFSSGAVTIILAAIAYTRVALGYHTIYETITGLLVGIQVLIVTYFLLFRNKTLPYFSLRVLGLLLFLSVFMFHGLRMPAELFLHNLIFSLKTQIPFCT